MNFLTIKTDDRSESLWIWHSFFSIGISIFCSIHMWSWCRKQWLLFAPSFIFTKYSHCDKSLSDSFVWFLQGVPFRTSHDIVGRSVALCVSKNCQLLDLSLDELRSLNPVFDKDVYEFLGVENAVEKFSSYGSTGSSCVANQLKYWVTKLKISTES